MPLSTRGRFAPKLKQALTAVVLAAAGLAAPAAAGAQGLFTQPKYAAIVEDANTGEVLYSFRADALRHPASLTKIMTLYLTFEALATGRLRMGDVITISPHAYSMMPSKVSTHPGETLTVAEAIPAMTVHSANDVAVAMAERLGGSEGAFARLMTLRAHELGMQETSFVNASGLPPDGQQISSARDMAILSRAVMRDYPQYYHFFGLKDFVFHGKVLPNHNHLVARMPGVDGMKTGYTSLAGFNLVASGVRGGHRLITVVLGGPSVAARDDNVEELLDAGFAVLQRRAAGQTIRLASLIASPEDMSGPVERPPVEMGSGDQPNLQVEVQPQIHTLPSETAVASFVPPAAPPAAAAREVAADAGTPAARADCGPIRRGRHHRRAASACATEQARAAKAGAKAETVAAAGPADDTACENRRYRRRHPAACRAAEKAAATETAKAAPKLKPELASAEDAKGRTGKGGYMIQVGAYKSQALAQGQVDKLSGAVAGSGKVEKAGGNYRARFAGLTQAEAKSACQKLAAKHQACMVMAAAG
jgi:D-alanyl-D-alanine carboxypeptidase